MTGGEQQVLVIAAVGDAIRELAPVPSGHVYANLMDKLTFAQYVTIINILAAAGLIKVQNHLIMWVGGDKDVALTLNTVVGSR